eukprot:744229-Prorocentrum_minimum.AAC.4
MRTVPPVAFVRQEPAPPGTDPPLRAHLASQRRRCETVRAGLTVYTRALLQELPSGTETLVIGLVGGGGQAHVRGPVVLGGNCRHLPADSDTHGMEQVSLQKGRVHQPVVHNARVPPDEHILGRGGRAKVGPLEGEADVRRGPGVCHEGWPHPGDRRRVEREHAGKGGGPAVGGDGDIEPVADRLCNDATPEEGAEVLRAGARDAADRDPAMIAISKVTPS